MRRNLFITAAIACLMTVCGCAQTGLDAGWKRVWPFDESEISIAIPEGYVPEHVDGIDSNVARYRSPDNRALMYIEQGSNDPDFSGRDVDEVMPLNIQGQDGAITICRRQSGVTSSPAMDHVAWLLFSRKEMRTRASVYFAESHRGEAIAILKSFKFWEPKGMPPRVGSNVIVEPKGWRRVTPFFPSSRSIAIPDDYTGGPLEDVHPELARYVSKREDVEVFIEMGGDDADVPYDRQNNRVEVVEFHGLTARMIFCRRMTDGPRDHAVYLRFDDYNAVGTRIWIFHVEDAQDQAVQVIKSFMY